MFDLRLKMRDARCERRVGGWRVSTPRSSSLAPRALTLIELLVVIVILTTLVAGVIPVLSPNNDTRKIREASRGLQTYITMAQAEAARTGREHGIAFQETAAGSGIALEVFRLEVPEEFRGFSTYSAARIIREETAPNIFVYYVQFVLSDTATGVLATAFPPTSDYLLRDAIPPLLIRYGDEVTVAGTRYRFIDEDFDGNGTDDAIPNDLFYTLDSGGNHTEWTFRCEPINEVGQTLAFVHTYSPGSNTYSLTAPKSYEITRQPVNSAEVAYQLPSAIAIDMQGSVVEGSSSGGFPTDGSLFVSSFAAAGSSNTVGIMFSPTGTVSNVLLNGNSLTNVSRIVLLLGRVENGGLDPTAAPAEWVQKTNEEVEMWQARINWLNLDSRWISIAATSGRVVVAENAFANPASMIAQGLDPTLAEDQIESAHEFAHEMRRGGGG